MHAHIWGGGPIMALMKELPILIPCNKRLAKNVITMQNKKQQ
jgi:hypothetical protein